MAKLKKGFSTKGLLNTFNNVIDKIKDNSKIKSSISVRDSVKSGLAIFYLKYKSLLQFDNDAKVKVKNLNLKRLFGMSYVPSDTYMREQLDELEPNMLRPVFTKIFSKLQRAKVIKKYEFINNTYLISVDGTGLFSSNKVHCDNCCETHHQNGKVSYSHKMLNAVMVSPNIKQPIALAPEPIVKQDGVTKNDCELNAGKRLLNHIRREHPHLKITILEDSLYGNGPHIQLLNDLKMNFIINVKEGSNETIFKTVANSKIETYEYIDDKDHKHTFNYINNISLNSSHKDLKVNFLEYIESSLDGIINRFTWITDHQINKNNCVKLMKGARCRWKIENETHNTLKNQGYNYEHNYGHGYKNLCTVFSYLMMIAFLIDQVQMLCNESYKTALLHCKTKYSLWSKVREYFLIFDIECWDRLYEFIANIYTNIKPIPLPP